MLPWNMHPHGQMPKTKIKAFFQEFPQLQEFAEKGIKQVYVSRLSADLLDARLKAHDVGFLIPEYEHEYLYLLDENLSVVHGERKGYRKKFIFFGPRVAIARVVRGVLGVGTSLEMSVALCGDAAERTAHILFYSQYAAGLILYKLPPGVQSLAAYLREDTRHAQQTFAAA